MRVGVVTNLFPPEVVGGYEIGCGEVVEGLRARGMDVQVLTSTLVPTSGRDFVYPKLECSIRANVRDMSRLAKLHLILAHEKKNLETFRAFIRSQKPDVIYFWNLSHTSRSLIALAKQSGIRTGLFAFDLGLLSDANDLWTAQSRLLASNPSRFVQSMFLRVAGPLLGRPTANLLEFDFVHCPTKFLEEKLQTGGVRSKSWEQIPWGVDTEIFHPGEGAEPGKILFTGQVTEHKGVHVLIEAVGKLQVLEPDIPLRLTIAGPLLDVEYKIRLDAMIKKHDLNWHVVFAGPVNRAKLPELYRDHSIYVFPSIWEEPMGIGILEAMASGLAVVGSGTGGSGELFADGESGVLFRRGDSGDLTTKMQSLIKNPAYRSSLCWNARQRACENHGCNQMLALLKQFLC
jgi:glycogen(starch) synthase